MSDHTPRFYTFDELNRMNSAAVAAAAHREAERLARLHAEHVARTAAAPCRERGGVPAWVTWGVLAPLTLVCPPVGLPLLVMALAGERR